MHVNYFLRSFLYTFVSVLSSLDPLELLFMQNNQCLCSQSLHHSCIFIIRIKPYVEVDSIDSHSLCTIQGRGSHQNCPLHLRVQAQMTALPSVSETWPHGGSPVDRPPCLTCPPSGLPFPSLMCIITWICVDDAPRALLGSYSP